MMDALRENDMVRGMRDRSHEMRRRSSVGVVAAASLLALLAGCATETISSTDGRPMPPAPRPAPVTPDSAHVSAMALRVGARPQDTDGNGYPDEIPVEIYLVAEPHPAPVHEVGMFTFELRAQGESHLSSAEPLARWELERERVQKAQMKSPIFGRGYFFKLNLNQVARGDRYPLMAVTLSATFIPANADRPAVHSGGAYTVQIGKGSSVASAAQ